MQNDKGNGMKSEKLNRMESKEYSEAQSEVQGRFPRERQGEKLIDIVYNETGFSMEMETHYHNSHEIIYVEEGTVLFRINDREYMVEGQSIIFISNFESHEFKIVKYPYKRYFILIKPDYFHSTINEPVLASIFKQRPDYFMHVIKINKDDIILEEIREMYNEAREGGEFAVSALRSRLNLLFIKLYRNYKEYFPITNLTGTMKTVLEVQKFIDRNLKEDISLESLAKMFYTDMYYLSRVFKKVTGFTFKTYLIIQRISHAKDQLYETDKDVTRIALDSGFKNVNHFIRIFKKYEGITPYQYKKKLRGRQ
ncbi:MAG TPA: AraC family transcriptional regulator [Clostridiaceae bacterium]|nr:AraC family transcriptional regulator [Clostridiaceae bacterium]